MPKTKVKAKRRHSTQDVLLSEITDRQAKVDEFLELHTWYETVKDRVALYTKLKQDLLKDTDNTDANNLLTVVGQNGRVIFSTGQWGTIINDKSGLIKRIGQGLWNKISEVTLTDLKKVLSGNDIAEFTEQSRSHKRRIDEVILRE